MDNFKTKRASSPQGCSDNVADHLRARDLVMRFGWNAVAYQILNPGFTLWFSAHGDAVVGYVKATRRWVIAGAPVCAPEVLPRVIEQLEACARADGCKVCYFGAALRLYDDCKQPPRHCAVLLGAQPTWQPSGWNAIIKNRASVRAQLHRARNKHIHVSELTNPTELQVAPLRDVLHAWLNSRSMPPMHFLVEPDTLSFLKDRRVLVAHRHGQPCGFLIASPVFARNGWLIEQIIRHPQAPNGTNELLFHEAMLRFSEEKCNYVTLGLVPLSTHMPQYAKSNPLWIRLLFGWARLHGKRFYNFAGLEAFKSKFCPDNWEPIFAIATEPRFTPKTLWAISAAFSHQKSPITHGIETLTKAVGQELGRLQSKVTLRR